MIFNKYQINETVYQQAKTKNAQVVDQHNNTFSALWIPTLEKDDSPAKNLLQKLKYLQKVSAPSHLSIVEYGWDAQEESYCIISEYKNASSLQTCAKELKVSLFLRGIRQIIEGLQSLHQQQGLAHGAITPHNLLVDGDFYLIGFEIALVSSDLELQERRFVAPEKIDSKTPKGFPYQSDIFSIGKIIEWFLSAQEVPNFSEIDLLVAEMCAPRPSQRLNYPTILEKLDVILSDSMFTEENLVVLSGPAYNSTLLKALNASAIPPKFDVFPEKEGEDNIMLNMITEEVCLHALWLIQEETLCILEQKSKDNLRLKNGTTLNLPLYFVNSVRDPSQGINLTPLLKKIQQKKQQNRGYQKGKQKMSQNLGFFKKLLKKELEVLEENSLRVQYSSFQKEGASDIWFRIKEHEKYSKNSHLFSHIDRSSPPNADEFAYILSPTANKKEMKEPVRFSGITYDFNPKSRILKFKDCEGLDFDKIPREGYLFEDISQEEEEKKRQQAAIRKVEHNDVQNKELIHYLFNTEELEGTYLEYHELEQIFQKTPDGAAFQYSPNQTQAILNALHRAPLSIIQGPPGTGKTTVITEIIFQILHREPNATILVTSQTNDAVDHVLDNLLQKDIPIVRLSGFRKPKPSLQKHTLERKIEGWKQEVKQKTQKRWKVIEGDFLSAVERKNPFFARIIPHLLTNKPWKAIRGKIEKTLHRITGLEALKEALPNREVFIHTLHQELQCDLLSFLEQHQIHTEWVTVLSSLNTKSKLHQKLIDSIRVIGATTNHIASKKYIKYGFEFDYVIMDESGKATPAEALIPIVMAKKLVLVGDHRQLRPMLTANREVEQWLRQQFKKEGDEFDSWDDYFNRPSLFEQVITTIDDDFRSQLEECRRMPKDAVQFTSKCFYEHFDDQPIVPVPRKKDQEHQLPLKVNSSIIFLDIGNTKKSTVDGNGSQKNEQSAAYIPKLLRALDNFEGINDYSIGVITTYTAQLKEIKKVIREQLRQKKNTLKRMNLQSVTCSVVDRFQGLEKDIIILDLVRSQQKTLGFLANPNRINVALSRHKKLLIIIGNYDWLIQAPSPSSSSSSCPLQNYLKQIKQAWIVKHFDQLF